MLQSMEPTIGVFNGDKAADVMKLTTYLHLGPNLKTFSNTRTAPLPVCVVFNSVREVLYLEWREIDSSVPEVLRVWNGVLLRLYSLGFYGVLPY